MMRKSLMILLLAVLAPLGLRSEELLKNADLKDLNEKGRPNDWVTSRMPENAPWKIGFEDGVFSVCFQDERGFQGRIMQEVDLEYDRPYMVSFEYRSGLDPRLKADVLLVNGGPIYRSLWLPPSGEWTKYKAVFSRSRKLNLSKFLISVQNRSSVPVWYRNLSLKAADDPKLNFPKFLTQPVAPDDQLIMPENTKKYLQFVVRPENELKNYRVEAQLFNSAGKPTDTDIKFEKDRLLVGTSFLTDNLNILVVKFFDRKDGAMVGFNKIEIEKVPASELNAQIDWKKHGVVKNVEGKPVFPIMMFEATPSDFKSLKENGFNTVHSYGFESEKRVKLTLQNKEYLKDAEAAGLYVVLGMPRTLTLNPARQAELTRWVQDVKGFPAGLFYYSDEMFCIKKAPEKAFATVRGILEREDPARQWYPYDPPAKMLGKYIDGVMFIGSENTILLNKLRIGADKAFIHCFGHVDDLAPKASSEKYIAYNLIMPVLFGARGVSYWWYPALKNRNGEARLLSERLFKGTRALAQCAPAIVEEHPLPAWCAEIRGTGDVRYLPATDGKTVWILAGVPESGKSGELVLPVDAESIYGVTGAGKMFKFGAGDTAILCVKTVEGMK